MDLAVKLVLAVHLHNLGDYILQSDWQANEKTKKSWAAMVHATLYSLPFVLVTQSVYALTVIGVTHFAIDRWRLARYICWLKNFISPPGDCRQENAVSRRSPRLRPAARNEH